MLPCKPGAADMHDKFTKDSSDIASLHACHSQVKLALAPALQSALWTPVHPRYSFLAMDMLENAGKARSLLNVRAQILCCGPVVRCTAGRDVDLNWADKGCAKSDTWHRPCFYPFLSCHGEQAALLPQSATRQKTVIFGSNERVG